MVEVEVALRLDPESGAPILVLRDRKSGRAVPIWIGQFESVPIALALEGKTFPRPLPPQLMAALIAVLDGELELAVVREVRDGVFHASLFLRTEEGEEVELDCRPSDAVALALELGRPVYVSEDVLREAGQWIEGLD